MHVVGRKSGRSVHQSRPQLEITALAERQLGVVSHEQLVALGCGDAMIGKWLQRGRLIPLFRGVYAVGHSALRREGWFIAAVLAVGDGATLSHRSAAFQWGLLNERGSLIDVTTPRRSQDGLAGIRLHRPRSLDDMDLTQHGGIPITSIARTLIDLAHYEPEFIVRRAWDQAEVARLLHVDAVAAAVERAGPRKGIRKVKRLLFETHPEDLHRTRSGLERDFLRLIAGTELPSPLVNTKVLGWEVDFLFAKSKLIVETDGGPWHSTPLRRLRDQERDRVHRRAGYTVLRIPDSELDSHAAEVLEAVRSALDARRGPENRT